MLINCTIQDKDTIASPAPWFKFWTNNFFLCLIIHPIYKKNELNFIIHSIYKIIHNLLFRRIYTRWVLFTFTLWKYLIHNEWILFTNNELFTITAFRISVLTIECYCMRCAVISNNSLWELKVMEAAWQHHFLAGGQAVSTTFNSHDEI